MNRNGWILVAVLVGGCAALGTGVQRIDALGEQVADRSTLPALAAEPAPPPSPRTPVPASGDFAARISSYFDGNLGHRLYLQVDKPLYKPGETIWFKTWDLAARNLSGTARGQTLLALISPKGSIVLQKRLNMAAGTANNDFELPADAQGGEYTLRASNADGQKTERSIIVSAYEAPRMKKKLEFVNKSYGPGDAVSATLEIRRPTGEPLVGKSLTAVITIDGIELPKVSTTTNSDGAALLKFDLPKTITAGDGLLTVLVEDGGIRESISKSIPILLNKMSVAFYPEGGQMVAGLPTRVYFEAKTPLGKPADLQGVLQDDLGATISSVASYKNGLGRIAFTPASGRRYHLQINSPQGMAEPLPLPAAVAEGCVMRSHDDLDGQLPAVRVSVYCSATQKVVVAATVRDNVLDVAGVMASKDKPGVVYLASHDEALQHAAGVARITLFDQDLKPLAERLVFRQRRSQLAVSVTPDKKRYAPRGEVALDISTRDPLGKPVPADLAMAVVDDTVLSYADDKGGHLLSRLLLEPELPGKIEEPNFYTDLAEAKSALALDMLMGTHGYRRFAWEPVLHPTTPNVIADAPMLRPEPLLDLRKRGLKREIEADKPVATGRIVALPVAPPPALAPAPAREAGLMGLPIAVEAARKDNEMPLAKPFAARPAEKKAMALQERQAWAPVRVFPVPTFNPDYNGTRDDYRDTVFWAPSIKTDKDGKARVKFVLSDAVTSFRTVTEGVGGGAAGRNERVFKSSLPFSLSVKLPLEVSAGDKPLLPITLSNDSDRALEVGLKASFGELVQADGSTLDGGSLPAGQRKSLFLPLTVTGTRGIAQAHITASAGGLLDEVTRSIPVVPSGFPQLLEKSGQIAGEINHSIDLSQANPGSVQATIKVYPSTLSSMQSGLEGMLREPSGCFEQTSSSNYPNVMILQYLKQHDILDPALAEKSNKLLESGYKKLAGFESPRKGYEWFGGDPGHEALTAYGLLEFADMREIYSAVDSGMLARTAAWLKSRRDGNGGYLRDAKALDSFGRASPAVTDAYITWALVLAGESGLDKEVAKSAQLAQTSNDAYELALAAGTLLQHATTNKAGFAAAARLAQMQSPTGAWTQADHSITRSGGSNLHIETTALAILALLKSHAYSEQAAKGIGWLQNNRSGYGQWGATQATVLALKAMSAFDAEAQATAAAGSVALLVDGELVSEQDYAAGRRTPILFTGFEDKLAPGRHVVTLRAKAGTALPYTLAIDYRATTPASSAAAVASLSTTLAKPTLRMGETVRLTSILSNKTQTGQPMTLVRIGIPAGLSFQNWQLKALRENGQIAFFETRPREVVLYLRDLRPGEIKKLEIDLVATVPGSYSGPASSAYLYYNDSDKAWAAPLTVNINP